MAVALVTGASRGFGLALARSLALDGWTLVLDARGADALAEVAGELSQLTTVHAIPGDVADPWHRGALVAAAEAEGGRRPAGEQRQRARARRRNRRSPTTRSRSCSTCTTSTSSRRSASCSSRCRSLRRAHGTVVNITSDAGREAYEGWGGYGSSKAALEQLGHILAAEEPDGAGVHLRPRRHAYADAPGGVPGRGHLRSSVARDRRAGVARVVGRTAGERTVRGERAGDPVMATVREATRAGRGARHHARRGPDDGRVPQRSSRRAHARARSSPVPRRG